MCIGKIYADIHPGSHPTELRGSSLAKGNQVFPAICVCLCSGVLKGWIY